MIIKHCGFETILIDSRCLRKGILLHLTNDAGNTATTEISPLPGFSKETIQEAFAQLKELKRKLLTTWWTKGSLHLLSSLGLYPSVHCAVETALLDLLDPIDNPLPCERYGLLFGSPSEIFERAEQVASEGFTEVKVKLGHFSIESAHEVIDQIKDRFRLRLDLNQRWDLEDSLRFCSRYPQDFFEYIEEPVTCLDDLSHFTYPFALDESLRQSRASLAHVDSPYCKALIIKPTMLFPITPYLNLGPKVVLTSSFESPIGVKQIERMVHRYGLSSTLHGLDSLRYFEDSHDPMPHCEVQS